MLTPLEATVATMGGEQAGSRYVDHAILHHATRSLHANICTASTKSEFDGLFSLCFAQHFGLHLNLGCHI